MEIRHRISFGHRDGVEGILSAMGVSTERSPLPGQGYLLHLDITESDPNWPKIAALAEEKRAVNIYNTEFSVGEIQAADWVRMIPAFEQGYPQPESGWEKATYAGGCASCGAGYTQKAPFLLAKEPRLGKHDFVCLYWTYTFFCTISVQETLQVELVRGYDVWDTLLRKDREPSALVSQLLFPMQAGPGLIPASDLRVSTCAECGTVKYSPHRRGPMQVHRVALQAGTDIQTSHEWFGSGHMAFREVFVSKRLAHLAIERGWRGIQLKPITLI